MSEIESLREMYKRIEQSHDINIVGIENFFNEFADKYRGINSEIYTNKRI